MEGKLVITRREYMKGEDGYKIFSVRIKEETVKTLDIIAKTTNRSRNELINVFLQYAIKNVDVQDENNNLNTHSDFVEII